MTRSHLLPLVFALAILVRPCAANVVVRPHFGHPFIFAERIVFTSVDGTHLISIDKTGRLKWELIFRARVAPQRLDDSSLAVQVGRKVFRIDAQSGRKSDLLTAPRHSSFGVDSELGYSYFADTRDTHRVVRILDFQRNVPTWGISNLESIEHVTSTTIVGLTAVRENHSDSSYSIATTTLSGYDRTNGNIRWSMQLPGSPAEILRSVAIGDHLAVISGLFVSSLLILNPETGEVLSSRGGRYIDLSTSGERLAILEGTDEPGDATLSFCDLPSCIPSEPLRLSAKEILRFRLYKDYVITAGIYDTACFSRDTGRRLWQKGQLEWSVPFDGVMVITDFDAKRRSSRIVSVNLQTGTENVLFTRPVTRNDERAFLPW